MKIKIKAKHYVGMIFGLLIIGLDFFLLFNFTGKVGPKAWYFSPILVIGAFIGSISFLLDVMKENERQKELETKFLEFVRSLVETVRSGVSIPQGIVHVTNTDFGALTPYVKKLAHQIEWGFTLHQALTTFANDTKNAVIKRSVAIVIEAEKSGGDIGSVLEAVTASVLEIKKIKEERKSNAYTQTIQGYIIYFFFVAIMVVMQIYLIPKLSAIGGELGSGLGTIGVGGLGSGGGKAGNLEFDAIFTATLVVQGLFAGLMIGKFAEGDYKSGLKHSIFMVIGGYLLLTTVTGLLEEPSKTAALLLLIPYNLILQRKNG